MANQEGCGSGTQFREDGLGNRLMSVPGIGPTLAAVIACEIDEIGRFPSAG